MRATETFKEAAKKGLRFVGRTLPRPAGRRVVVLCYHSIHPSLPFRTTTPTVFSEHLAWLRENCRCIPFSEVYSTNELPDTGRPCVSITFDDGYADNHAFALPLLAQSDLTATFFLTTGLLEKDHATLEHFRYLRLVERDAIQPLEWAQVGEMLEAGMDVGAHTHHHPNLAGLSQPALEWEITHSRRVIEDRTGRSVTSMAYPFGRLKVHVTDRVVQAVRRVGYGMACTVAGVGVRSTDDPLAVPRIFVADASVDVLRDKVLGVWDLIGSVRAKMPLAVSRIVSPADFKV